MSSGAESYQDTRSFNQSVMDKCLSLQETIEDFNTTIQPAIDALAGHQVVAFDKTKQLTNQKLQRTGNQQQMPEDKQSILHSVFKRKRRTVKAQLYFPKKSGLASTVESEMSKMLQTCFKDNGMDLALATVDKGSSILPGVPVMVICIFASRLGTDVTSALKNLTVNKSMSVVVMHHKDIHALPKQSSDRVLTAAEYKQLGGIFDMAFVTGKGIYPCDMNKNAVSDIVDFINQHN